MSVRAEELLLDDTMEPENEQKLDENPVKRGRGRPRKNGETTPRTPRTKKGQPNYNEIATGVSQTFSPLIGQVITLLTGAAFGLQRAMLSDESNAIAYASMRMSLRRILPKVMPYLGGDLSLDDVQDVGMLTGATIAYFQRTNETAYMQAKNKANKRYSDYESQEVTEDYLMEIPHE